jgi:hypothetical protein
VDFDVAEVALGIDRLRRSGRRDLLEDPVERQTAAPFDGDDGHDGDDQQ